MPLAPLGILLILTIPFHPFWIDFELARRGLFLIAIGALLMRASHWWPAKMPAGSKVFLAFLAVVFLRTIGTLNPMDGIYRGMHLLALWLAMVWGSTQRIDGLLRACLPVTLILTVYGLLQAAGVVWPAGYAANQAVSTLGNLNVASEVLTMGAALAALHCARLPRPSLAIMTLGLTICYLSINGSRSAWLALAPVLVLVILGTPRKKQPLYGIALGIILATASHLATGSSEANESEIATATTRPSTIEVRFEIWQSCWLLFQEHWLLGQGTGEFVQQYPRQRSQHEIELSSFGRSFRAGVDTAHNDSIEIAVETGIIGLFLWFGFWLLSLARILRHEERGLSRLAPLLGFLALSLTRSPLGNAPAAAIAFLFLGTTLRRPQPDQDWVDHWQPSKMICICLGLGLIALGAKPLLSQIRAAEYLESKAQHSPNPRPLDDAIWWYGADRRLHELRVQERSRTMDPKTALAASTADLSFLIRHAPNNTTDLLLIAETLQRAGETDKAEAYLSRLLELDSRDPEAVLMLATIRCSQGQAPIAAAILYADPHPSLRNALPRHLGELAEVAQTYDDTGGAKLLRREQAFMFALLTLEENPASPLATTAVDSYRALVDPDEPRALILQATLALARGERARASELSQQASSGRPLNQASRRLMSKLLAALHID